MSASVDVLCPAFTFHSSQSLNVIQEEVVSALGLTGGIDAVELFAVVPLSAAVGRSGPYEGELACRVKGSSE